MRRFIFIIILILISLKPLAALEDSRQSLPLNEEDLKYYIDYFDEVFHQFNEHYFIAPKKESLEEFVEKFKTKIYPQLAAEGKSNDYVRWRASWYLVDQLKFSKDHFTQFYPPKPAEKFEKEALGQRVDLGIEGKRKGSGFEVTRVEPHSDAYAKNLRESDVIVKFNGRSIKKLSDDQLNGILNPVVDTEVSIEFQSGGMGQQQKISVKSQEYFRQTVFMCPVAVEGIFCLEVKQFNRMSGQELFLFLKIIMQQNPKGLIIDLRDNPGGPPLAAREMAAFFLDGGDLFAYFQRRDVSTRSELDVPVVDEALKFHGPVVMLVNNQSGSAAELFAGIMQYRQRALVLGEETAGQVLLKSMFELKDGAMIAMVTGLGYYPNDKAFGFEGVVPDKQILGAPKDGLINLAASMIIYVNQQSKE